MAHRREVQLSLTPVQLTVCVALGLWLGAMAIGLTFWLVAQLWPQQVAPVAQVFAPAAARAPAAQPDDAQQHMFERYQHTLQQQQAEQAAEAAQGNPRNLNNPKCQFWLQQNRTAPTDKSQANVLEFCY